MSDDKLPLAKKLSEPFTSFHEAFGRELPHDLKPSPDPAERAGLSREVVEAVAGDASLSSAVGYAGAVLAAHANKLPVPSHAKALATRCQEAAGVLAALTPPATRAEPSEEGAHVPITGEVIRYVQRYQGRNGCRDCADEAGFCPSTGIGCGESDKAIRFVLEAVNYGVSHGYLRFAQQTASGQGEGGATAGLVDHGDLVILRALLCLSGFIGEGVRIEGFEDPAGVYCDLAAAFGLEDLEDDGLRAHIKIEEDRAAPRIGSIEQ